MNYQMKLQVMKIYGKLLVLVFVLTSFFAVTQFNIPPKPSLQTSVYDYAKMLSDTEFKTLEQKLINYYDTTGNQIVVAIVKSVEGGDIGLIASEWGHSWGVGGKDDNGVFILLSQNDREIYIAPGYGLEHLLTAGINGEIIRNDIIPHFKEGNYYQGLEAGTDQLIKLFSGAYKKKEAEPISGWYGLLFLGLIVLFFYWIFKNNKKNGGGKGNGGRKDLSWMEAIMLGQTISSGGNRSYGGGFGGRGFSGGGFSGGFGGGGFSGGGAGGRW